MLEKTEKNSTNQQDKLQDAQKSINVYAKYAGLAGQLFATIGLGVWGGILLDKYFSLNFPIFTVVLSLTACIGAMVLVIKSVPKA
jgi:F0F1-type ATP synthase assembly protein I